jgi:hypothetical protein
MDGLYACGIMSQLCQLVYEIEILEESFPRFQQLYHTSEKRRRVNLLDFSTSAQTTTNAIIEQLTAS